MPNETITVYHGTNLFSAKLIHLYGIRLDAQRRFSDFGRGFYVTFNSKQAMRWAIVRANNVQVSPQLLEKFNISQEAYLKHNDARIPVLLSFELDLQKLLKLNGKMFPLPNNPNWEKYHHKWKQFVYKCRAGQSHYFHFVYGPIGGGHFKNEKKIQVSKSKEQLSLNSINAIKCISDLRIHNLSPCIRSVMSKESLLLLREVKKLIINEFGLTNDRADSLTVRSWLAALDQDVLLHESPYYWALSLIYGRKRLWHLEYEDILLKGNSII